MAKAKSKSKKATKGTYGLVTFLLDRTSSMGAVKAQTIEAFNAYVKTLQTDAKETIFNLIQFDTISIDKDYVNTPIKDVKPLNDATYQPRGATPLIDAAYKTIKAVEKSVGEMSSKPRITVCIQTDGEENSSTEHTWDQLQALIKEKTQEGWEFLFMGCGIDAYQQGAKMGVSVANTVSYGKDRRHTMASFRAAAANTANYSTGLSGTASFSASQKLASGDVYDQTWAGNVVLPTPTAVPNAIPTGTMPQQPTTTKKPKIVDDITL